MAMVHIDWVSKAAWRFHAKDFEKGLPMCSYLICLPDIVEVTGD